MWLGEAGPIMLPPAKLGADHAYHERCDLSGRAAVGSVCSFQRMSGAGLEAIVSRGVPCKSDWLLENPD